MTNKKPKKFAIAKKVKKICIQHLKGLNNVEIDLSSKPLIAILGPNGCGKTTILHALACINSPLDALNSQENYKFCNFFKPTVNNPWNGSSFNVIQLDSDNKELDTKFEKSDAPKKTNSRWTPKYSTRLQRYISYIGIRTCVPQIELESQNGKIHFDTTTLSDEVSEKVKEKSGCVMNRNYSEYNMHLGKRRFIGVKYEDKRYSALSMGAGEQRVFYILSEIIKAPKYALILIDEIEILLHQDALHRLLSVVNEIAERKELQVIFTTHNQSILNIDYIANRHIFQTPEKTLCFEQTNAEIMQRLTGIYEKKIEIFVEDDLSKTMVEKLCAQKKISQFVSIKCFGACENCFAAVCGSILCKNDNIDNMLFVIDGDRYVKNDEKMKQIQKHLTGDSEHDKKRREEALEKIVEFKIPNDSSPEEYYCKVICSINDSKLDDEQKSIKKLLSRNVHPVKRHDYINSVVADINLNREVALYQIINILACSDEWENIIAPIKDWLDIKRILLSAD